jgi:DNA-binding NtrC family response regulator
MVRKTILVVDDEPDIRSLVKSVLSRHKHRILDASDGVAAVSVFERAGARIDLLLTDIVMPRLDGVELAGQLTSRSPALRVIYMSGRCEAEAVQRDMETKGFGFLRKPFRIGELELKVREFLDGPPRQEARRETGSQGKKAAGATGRKTG